VKSSVTFQKKDLLQTVFCCHSGASSIKEFAERYQISYEELARTTGFSRRAISNWSEGSKPSPSTTRRLNEIKRLFAALENLLASESIGSWLRSPNPAFHASTPLQVIERGESDRIWRMVCELEI
jgi:transcriptional regulator with XRE-family HTH domain